MLEDIFLRLEGFIVVQSFSGIIASFIAGILSSLLPCTYPLIPITLGVIGAYSVSSKKKGFFLSLIFVLGIATIYTFLGVLSASLGIFLGGITTHPLFYSLIGGFLIFFGFYQFELIKIPLFRFKINYNHKGSYFSLFLAGAASGVIALACIFPVMGTILTMISINKNIIYGGLSLFFFSLGYGVFIIILGTFTSLISKLPKSGPWLIIVKRCIGTLLVITGVYFLMKAFYFL